MNGLLEAARRLEAFCDGQGWESCFIGGIAVQRWSEPRVTRDLAITLLTGFGREDEFIDTFLNSYDPRIANAKEFALKRRILLLQTEEGVGMDISLGGLPFEEQVVRRASIFAFAPGIHIRTCSAEDLLAMKLFASRPLDIRDAEGIALRHKHELNWGYVDDNLRPLAELKDEAGIMSTMTRLRQL